VPGKNIDDGSLYQDGGALDEHDPNFDSEDETGFEYVPHVAALRRQVGGATITLTKYKKQVEPLIAEFFVSGDTDEILRSIADIGAPQYTYEFVKRAVNMSFDKKDRERELVSRLLSVGYPDTFSSSQVGKGIERLFELIDEIVIDAPAARDMLAVFVARTVVDEVLPPSFLSDPVVLNLGGDIIDRTKRMLSRDHGGAKLEKGWGAGDGRPVEEMKVAVDQLLQEYLVSGDLDEAARCIYELNSPLFYHEVVKRAIVQAMDKDETQQIKMSDLLIHLVERDQLTAQQAIKGFNRLFGLIDDLKLDTPTAPAVLNAFVTRAIQESVLPADYKPNPIASSSLPPSPSPAL